MSDGELHIRCTLVRMLLGEDSTTGIQSLLSALDADIDGMTQPRRSSYQCLHRLWSFATVLSPRLALLHFLSLALPRAHTLSVSLILKPLTLCLLYGWPHLPTRHMFVNRQDAR